MMICPKCGAEYRQGFSSCSDCHVLLVQKGTVGATQQKKAWSVWATREDEQAVAAEAGKGEGDDLEAHGIARETLREEEEQSGERTEGADEAVGDPSKDPFCSFWKGTDLRVCTEICTVLDEAGIPHKTVRRQDHLFNLNNQSPYEVGVPASLYEKAEKAIQDAFGTDEEGEDEVKLLPPAEEAQDETMKVVWKGDEMMSCARMCQRLKDADIEYYVRQQRKHITPRRLEEHYEIDVYAEDYKRAVAITGGVPAESEKKPEVEEIEIPERPETGPAGSEWVEGREMPHGGEFYPEEATSLVWEGELESWRGAIEMSLREFDIPMRWDIAGGVGRVYVLPEDEVRAKQVVQEVVTGEPAGEGE
jgi:hypothetical protein